MGELLTTPSLVPDIRLNGATHVYPWPLKEAGGLLLPGERRSVPEPEEPGCGEKYDGADGATEGALGVVGFVFVVARRERGEEAGGVSLSLSLLDDDEGRRNSDAKRLCLAGGVCDCMSECRAVDDEVRETDGMAARCAGEFAGRCRVQRCTITKES